MGKVAISITISNEIFMELERFAGEKGLKNSPALELLLRSALDFQPQKLPEAKDLKEIKGKIAQANLELVELRKAEENKQKELKEKEQMQIQDKEYWESQFENPEKAARAKKEADYLEERKKKPKIKFTKKDHKEAEELEAGDPPELEQE